MKTRSIAALAIAAGFMQLSCNAKGPSASLSCGEFVACGGDPTGIWLFQEQCANGSIPQFIEKQKGKPAACAGMVTGYSMSISGSIAYTAGVQTTSISQSARSTYHFSSACLTAIAGKPTVGDPSLCVAMADMMAGNDLFDTVDGVVSGSDCEATLVSTPVETKFVAPYTLSGNVIVEASGRATTFCQTGDALSVFVANQWGTIGMEMFARRQ